MGAHCTLYTAHCTLHTAHCTWGSHSRGVMALHLYLALAAVTWIQSPLALSCSSLFARQEPQREDTSMEGASLLREVTDKDLGNVIQCQQDGVDKCTAVEADMEFMRNLKAGSKLTLLPGFMPMEVRMDPQETSGGGLSSPSLQRMVERPVSLWGALAPCMDL